MTTDEKPMVLYYFAILEKNKAGRWFAHVPDLDGVIASGATSSAALHAVAERAGRHLVHLVKAGEVPPEPTDIEKVSAPKGAFPPVLVPVPMPGKQIKISISINDSLLVQVDTAAARDGMTRSGFLAQAAIEKLETDAEDGAFVSVNGGRGMVTLASRIWGLGEPNNQDIKDRVICLGVGPKTVLGPEDGMIFVPLSSASSGHELGMFGRGSSEVNLKVRSKSPTIRRK